MLNEPEEAIVALTDAFAEANEHYPLQQRGESRGFAQRLDGFIAELVVLCRGNVLHDEVLLPHLVSWFTVLSHSPVRAFRHTGTHCALELGDQLIRVLAALDVRYGEVSTLADKATGAKAKQHAAELQRLQAQTDLLEAAVQQVYDGVLVHRYADTALEIRVDCVRHLGGWIVSLPAIYLDDKYLKYMGWMMSDNEAAVRAESLRDLRGLLLEAVGG